MIDVRTDTAVPNFHIWIPSNQQYPNMNAGSIFDAGHDTKDENDGIYNDHDVTIIRHQSKLMLKVGYFKLVDGDACHAFINI